jgi:sugar lactone lactonase YvrE
MKVAGLFGALILSATNAFGALSSTFNSPYDVGATASSYTASGALTFALNFSPTPGQQLLLVNNTGAGAISGTFTGLAEGATRTATYGGNTFTFRISYVGGTGNDITLTRVAGAGQVTSSNTYLWSHLAGSTGGPGSLDATGPQASFNWPRGVAVDGAGNVYVADTNNQTIRKVTPAGVVTTLAGTALSFGSTDGTGSAARFRSPSSVAVDSLGNLYVADTVNHTIRKVSSAGVVTTLAGTAVSSGSTNGTGSAARFNSPYGVAVDSARNVYVADTNNQTIRKVTPAGVVTTLAGTAGSFGSTNGTGSAARFSSPYGVALDSSGNVYVADYANTMIRKVTSAGVVTTLAGATFSTGSTDGTGSAAQFGGAYGLAVDSSGNVYVADTANHTIRKVSSVGVVTTLAGTARISGSTNGTGSAARFYNPSDAPSGIAVDSAGNVYVADTGNHTIRKVSSAGVVTTLAGTAGSFGSIDGTGSAARFRSPSGVAVDSSGNLYVADAANHMIRKVTPAGVVTTLAGTARISGSTDGTGSAARFNDPWGIAVDNLGNVYVADTFNHTIRQVTPAGVVTTLVGSAGTSGSTDGTGSNARFNNPFGVAVDTSGYLYIADTGNSTIRKVTPAGVVTTLAGTASSRGSTDGMGTSARFGFGGPQGVAVDSVGSVYVVDSGNHTIRKVTPAGMVTTLAGTAGVIGENDGWGSAARFNAPDAVTVSASGLLFVTTPYRLALGELAGFQSVLTQGSAISQSHSSVMLNGTVNPNGFVTTASFEYGLTSTYGSSASVTLSPSNDTAEQNVSAALTGLSPATLYYYRLTASNVDGTTSTSGGTFTTMSAMSTNADLSGLTLSSGTLSPSFASATTSYTASVANATASITITATSAQANATLAVRANAGAYAAVISGSPSSAMSLNVGSNTIDVRVTAQDGVTQKIYTIAVTRLPSNNASLSGLTLSRGTLSPFFATATNSYTASVANSNASITVTPASADANATLAVRVNGGTYAGVTSGSPSSALPLNVGSNTIDVRVTAQDGVTQKTYSITVTRLASALPQLLAETYHAPSGQSLSYQIASTSELPVTFSATGLPAGLTLDAATGIISGTVAVAGAYSVTTTVSNGGEQSSATLTLVVTASALPFISGPGTVLACVGQVLNHSFGAGNSPTAAGILNLPPGLRQFDSNDDGVMDSINGTPLIAGSFRVTFWAENALGRCTRSVIIRINKPAVTASAQMFEGLDVRAMAKDGLGNTVLGARIHGPVVVGGTTYTPVNLGSDGLVIKISSTGQVLWGYQLTGTYGCDLENLVVDSSGNIIACGQINSLSSTFAGSAVSGQTFFVVKLTSAGTRSWTRVQGVGGGNVYCGALAVDASNNIWVGGYFQGSLGFSNSNNTTLTSSSLEAINNGFVAGFSSSGTVLTPRLFGSTSVSQIYSLAAAPDGTVFVAGNFSGNLTVPGSGSAPTASITLTNPDGNASQPSFVACIGGVSAGTTTHAAYWARQIPDGNLFFRNCMVADSSGGLYVTGYEDLTAPPVSSLPANSIALPENRSGAFLMRLSATTTYGLSWIKDLPGNSVPALAYDGVGSLYLENSTNSGNFDDMAYNGSTGRYLAKVSTSGAVLWVRDSVNAATTDYPLFAVDSGGNLSLASMSDGAPISTGDQSVSGAGTGLFLLGNATSSGAVPVITSTLTRSWVASRSYSREYTYQIQATNSPTSYWVSDLPEGVQFDESTGVITATPSEAGTYTSTIWAMNAAGYGSATLTITVTPDPDPEITSPATATATVGQPFSYQITATNSPTSFAAIGNNGFFGELPDGLSFNSTTGLIQGTPTLAGSTFFVVRASNVTGDGSLFVTLTVAGNPAIAPPTLQAGSITATVGQPLSYQIQATGALRYGATSAGSSASGLICDKSTGLISWTPAAAGTYAITLQGINGGGVTSALLQITVSPANGSGGAINNWRQQYFGSDQNSGNAADLATPDGDGIPNLIKYALLMTPGQNGSSRLPQGAMTGPSGNRRLTLTFQCDPSRNDVAIVVEAQSGLDSAWAEIARSTNGAEFTGAAAVSESVGTNGSKAVTVQDVQANGSRRFMRVRVER